MTLILYVFCGHFDGANVYPNDNNTLVLTSGERGHCLVSATLPDGTCRSRWSQYICVASFCSIRSCSNWSSRNGSPLISHPICFLSRDCDNIAWSYYPLKRKTRRRRFRRCGALSDTKGRKRDLGRQLLRGLQITNRRGRNGLSERFKGILAAS
jgi:hypothetical protein